MDDTKPTMPADDQGGMPAAPTMPADDQGGMPAAPTMPEPQAPAPMGGDMPAEHEEPETPIQPAA